MYDAASHQEFIRFLAAVERAVPAGKVIHAILNNYDHPRWTFHFTPTSASTLKAVEGFFSTITRRKICRGVFRSVPELEAEIARCIKALRLDEARKGNLRQARGNP